MVTSKNITSNVFSKKAFSNQTDGRVGVSLFYFVVFCLFALFWLILFYFGLFCFLLLYFALVCLILLYFALFVALVCFMFALFLF